MSESVNSVASTLASLGLTAPEKSKVVADSASTLSQADFLRLLTAQLQNQSPLNPADTSQFTSQMAQLGTVSGIQELNSNVKNLSSSMLSNQTLQASSLVGRSVSVPNNNTVTFDGSTSASGTLMLDQAASNIVVSVKDSTGTVIKNISLGSAAAGNLNFTWDGKSAGGQTAPAGTYQITATGQMGNATTALNVATANKITSITLGSGGSSMMLNLANGSQASINNIIQLF